MHYVYVIQSLKYPENIYIGCTENLAARVETHNSGGSQHTAMYRPWEVILALAFKNKDKAIAFEKYLKSGSGRAFAKKRLW